VRDRGARARSALAIVASAGAMTLYSYVSGPTVWLGWVGLAPWLATLDAAADWRQAAWRGLAMCLAYTLGLFWWFGVAVEHYAGWPRGSWLVITLAGAPLLQPQFVVVALARRLAARRGRGALARALVTSGAYVGTEWLFPKLLGDTIGYGFLPARAMRQAADAIGAPGLTAVLLLSNDAVLAVFHAWRAGERARAWRAAAAVAGLAAALGLYGAWRLHALAAATAHVPAITVGVVQGGFADYARLREAHGSFEATRRILNRYFALSDGARDSAQLLVWPETVYPTTFGHPKSEDGAVFDRALARFVSSAGIPLVFGGYDLAGDGVEYNAAIVLEPGRAGESVTFDAYRKTWLFPLTERVPAFLDRPEVRRRLPWLGTWKGGDGPMVLWVHPKDAEPLRIAPLVCYDAVVPSHARAAALGGAQLLVTLSNDAWFGRGPGTWLSLAASVFRTIETHRPQVRATTTGISAVVDASGEIVDAAAPGARGTLVDHVVPAALPPTLAMRFGDWLSPSLLVVAGVLLLW
jgi:apolipoprotein N-acyltransferase